VYFGRFFVLILVGQLSCAAQTYEDLISQLKAQSGMVEQAKFIAKLGESKPTDDVRRLLFRSFGHLQRGSWEVGGEVTAFHKGQDPAVIALLQLDQPNIVSVVGLGERRSLFQLECMAFVLQVKDGKEASLRVLEQYLAKPGISDIEKENARTLAFYLAEPKLMDPRRLSDSVKPPWAASREEAGTAPKPVTQPRPESVPSAGMPRPPTSIKRSAPLADSGSVDSVQRVESPPIFTWHWIAVAALVGVSLFFLFRKSRST